MSNTAAPPAYSPSAPQQAVMLPSNVLLPDNSYQNRLARRNALVQHHSISERYQAFLEKLCAVHLVIIPDDSSSMNTRHKLNEPTEWENLGATTRVIAEVGTIYDEEGIDVCFLNRGEVDRVRDPNTLYPYFAAPAQGCTPLVPRLQALFERHRNSEKGVVFIIPTDGVPTNDEGEEEPGRQALIAFMQRREKDKALCKKMPISFVMCTSNQKIIDFYDEFTQKFSNVTITENFAAEKREMNERFSKLSYSYGDWIVKIVLGAVVKEIGDMDQAPKGCCIIA